MAVWSVNVCLPLESTDLTSSGQSGLTLRGISSIIDIVRYVPLVNGTFQWWFVSNKRENEKTHESPRECFPSHFFFCLCLLFFSFVSSYIGQVREYEDCLFEI